MGETVGEKQKKREGSWEERGAGGRDLRRTNGARQEGRDGGMSGWVGARPPVKVGLRWSNWSRWAYSRSVARSVQGQGDGIQTTTSNHMHSCCTPVSF